MFGIPRDMEEKSMDGEDGFHEKGSTIAYMMQRFRSSQPTDPEERRRQRASGDIKDFWWHRNRMEGRETSSDDYRSSDVDSQAYGSSSSPMQESFAPSIPKPESYTAQLTAKELDRLKRQQLQDLRLDSESESPYTESEGLLTESHDESVSDASSVEVGPNLERDARAAIAKARLHLSRVEEDEEVRRTKKAVHFDSYVTSNQQKEPKSLNNMIDTLDLAMKSIRSRAPAGMSDTVVRNSKVEAKLAEDEPESATAIPMASGVDAPTKLADKATKAEELIAKAAEELVPDHSRYHWYSAHLASDQDSILDENYADDQQSLAETASTANVTPTKPSDINEDLDIALLCLNNRLKGKKEDSTRITEAERLASLKAQVIAKVDETVKAEVQTSQSELGARPQAVDPRSAPQQRDYQPSEAIARELLQRDDRICLFQNFKLREQQGTSLINVAAAVRVLTETMKVSGLDTSRVTEENVLGLADIPNDEKASRHLTFDEVAVVYDSLAEHTREYHPRDDYSSDDTDTDSEQASYSKHQRFEGVTAQDIRGLQQCIEKVLTREERSAVPERKQCPEQEPVRRNVGLYPGDIPETVQPVRQVRSLRCPDNNNDNHRVPLAVHPFPIHQAPAVAIGAGPHFLSVAPPYNPEHQPSAPPANPVNPNLIVVDRNIMNSAVQDATIDYYKRLSEKFMNRKTCVEEGVQATLGTVQSVPRNASKQTQVCPAPEPLTNMPVQWRYDAATRSLTVMNPKENERESAPKAVAAISGADTEEKPSIFKAHRHLLTSAMDKLDHLKRLRMQLSEA